MKKTILIGYSIFQLCGLISAQNDNNAVGKVKYIFITGINEKPDSNVAALYFSSHYSIFKWGQTIHEEVEWVEKENNNYKIEGDKEGSVYFANFSAKKMVSRELLYSSYCNINETLPKINWDIKNENKEISGIKCNHAVGEFRGRIYDVWFAPSIPSQAGPWKLNGLPGLILEAQDRTDRLKYQFLSIEIPLKETVSINEPIFSKIPSYSWENYYNLLKQKYENMIKSVKAASKGGTLTVKSTFDPIEKI